MRFTLMSLLFVLGCSSVVTESPGDVARDSSGIEGQGGAGGSPETDGNGGAGTSGTGGSGGMASGAGGDIGVIEPDSCLRQTCSSEGHILRQLKPDSTWMPSGDPLTVDCPPLSELQDPEPGVCFLSEPTVEDPGDGLMCCYMISLCCL
ncbi:hypothetical protein [Sorangium sp. So ce1182]|uniref:hypothetical protein n=1 Tax=Sorangium sp. So ce1182 TaxID=3133334 RepID=UPI003F61DDA6